MLKEGRLGNKTRLFTALAAIAAALLFAGCTSTDEKEEPAPNANPAAAVQNVAPPATPPATGVNPAPPAPQPGVGPATTAPPPNLMPALPEPAAPPPAVSGELVWYSYRDAAELARDQGKFIMVDFYTTWCHWCKKLDSVTYTDPRVIEALNRNFVVVKIDAESDKEVVYGERRMTMSEFSKSFNLQGFPSIVFMDKDGRKIDVLSGYLPPDDFLQYLDRIKAKKQS